MDVKLPNGTIIKGVPEGTTKEQVAKKAIAAGLAKPQDFGMASELPPVYSQTGEVIPANVPQPRRELPLEEQAIGAGETALAAITGATSGALGYVGGAARGLGNQLLGDATAEQAQRSAEQGAEMLTYAPRTEAGQRMTQALGEAASVLPPVIAGITPMQAQGAANAARATAAAARGIELPQVAQRGDFAARSGGAAEIPADQQRRNLANELPVPLGDKLTKGMATQDFETQNFERETAKNPELGAPIRERVDDLTAGINQNLDEMLSLTGSKLPETAWQLETGNKVIQALKKGYDAETKKVNAAYNVARQRGETQAQLPVEKINEISTFVNSNRAKRTNAPVLEGFVREVEVQELGGGRLDDGSFYLNPMTIEQSETLRQQVNRLTDKTKGEDIYYAGQIKKLIDNAQDGAGGQAFKSARKMRGQLAGKYENLAIIDKLLDTQGNYADQKIASEQVFNKAILNGSVEDVVNLRRVLSTAGDDGLEALQEVRAAAIRHIRDEATRNLGALPDGTPRISPKGMDNAIKSLDKNGKLDKLFGKTGAQSLRTLNDVTKDIFVAQPNAVNTSNTAANVMAALDFMTTASIGVPAPILTTLRLGAKRAKDAKIKKKVKESLE